MKTLNRECICAAVSVILRVPLEQIGFEVGARQPGPGLPAQRVEEHQLGMRVFVVPPPGPLLGRLKIYALGRSRTLLLRPL